VKEAPGATYCDRGHAGAVEKTLPGGAPRRGGRLAPDGAPAFGGPAEQIDGGPIGRYAKPTAAPVQSTVARCPK